MPHDQADQVVNQGNEVSSFRTPGTVLQCNTSSPPRGLEVRQRGLDRPTLAVQCGEVGHPGDCRVEERGHQGDLAGSEAGAADVVAHLSEHSRLWQGRHRFPGEPRGTGLGFQPGDELVIAAARVEPA